MITKLENYVTIVLINHFTSVFIFSFLNLIRIKKVSIFRSFFLGGGGGNKNICDPLEGSVKNTYIIITNKNQSFV